jgi:Tfp pilus assembly protein PilP
MIRLHVSLAAMTLFVSTGAALVVAQQPAPSPAASAPAAAAVPQTPAAPAAPTPPANFAYGAESRRDPFVALIGPTGQQRGVQQADVRVEGLPGIRAEELAVRGIIQNKGVWVAMISGPSGKVYTVRSGDRLADGTIQSVTADAVVILQQVNDPLSLEKQREVRKFLRGGENK